MSKEGLSIYGYIALISSSILGVVVISLPKIATESAQDGALLATVLASVLSIIFAISIALLGKRFRDKIQVEYIISILGKPLGMVFGLVTIVYFILLSSVALRGFSDALKGLLLHNTPLEIIMISMLLTAVYLCLNGIGSIAKMSELFLPIIFIALILVIGLSLSNFNYVRFRPLLTPSIPLAIKGTANIMPAFLGYEIIFVLIPFYKKERKVLTGTFIGILVPSILYVLLVSLSVGVFGIKPTQQINYPTITLARKINFPGAFAERFDIFFVILWILAAFTSIANFLYVSSLSAVRLFSLRNYQPFIYLIAPIVYIFAIFPQNLPEIRLINTYIGYLGLGISLFFTLLMMIIWIMGKRREKNV